MVIGIDPGITGAVVIITSNEILFYDTPKAEVKKGKKKHNEYLPSEMADILKDRRVCNTFAFVEKVHSMPGQGVASSFGFGFGFGLWIGILAAIEIPYTLVMPQTWKKSLMLGKSDKDAARIRAQELFPQYSPMLNRKKDIGRADALLIAEYGRRSMLTKMFMGMK